jgi:manganese transport protein
MATEIASFVGKGWRAESPSASLQEVYASIPIPHGAGFWRKMFAFAGPALSPSATWTPVAGPPTSPEVPLRLYAPQRHPHLQCHGNRPPGPGRPPRHRQRTRPRQACRDSYSKPVTIALWLLCEIASACDLAEVIGSAIALNLLFGLPLIWGVCLTALDVLVILFLQHRGFRYVEALVVGLILMIAGSFAVELWLSRPELAGVAAGFVPHLEIVRNGNMLYIAIGILGATVMPHNLYLHSSIVQTRKSPTRKRAGRKRSASPRSTRRSR